MLSPIKPYIVRKDSCGVRFDFVVADEVAKLWYDTPSGPVVEEGAPSGRLEVDRSQAIEGWKEVALLRDRIALPGSRVVECGCHHGLTTIMLAAWVGRKGSVTAFDAVLLNSLVAQSNLKRNGIANAAVFCAAVGGKLGLVQLYNDSNVITKESPVCHPDSNIMVRIDALLPGPPDALKLDVEGAELAFVESHREFLAAVPRLAIEVHTDLLPPGGVGRLIGALGDRPLRVLWPDGRYAEHRGEPIDERVHLFSY